MPRRYDPGIVGDLPSLPRRGASGRRKVPQPARRRPDLAGPAERGRLLGTGSLGLGDSRRTPARVGPNSDDPFRSRRRSPLTLDASDRIRCARRGRGAGERPRRRGSTAPVVLRGRKDRAGRARPGLALAGGAPALCQRGACRGDAGRGLAARRASVGRGRAGDARLAGRVETTGHHVSVTPVGGWARGEPRPGFDQQPLEVAALADACALAFDLTSDRSWARIVRSCASWFEGDNDIGIALTGSSGGGCDGLEKHGRNENQGAESTLAMLSTFQQARRLHTAAG